MEIGFENECPLSGNYMVLIMRNSFHGVLRCCFGKRTAEEDLHQLREMLNSFFIFFLKTRADFMMFGSFRIAIVQSVELACCSAIKTS